MIIGVKTTYKPDNDAGADTNLRGTHVQVGIIENGKYLLVKQAVRDSGRLFWGLPGGGVEPDETDEAAALREILEETGLRVRLLPYRIDRTGRFFDTYVTFLAYPLEGEEQIGTDPEPEMAYLYAPEELRWQDLNDDGGLDEAGLENIRPVRDLLESTDLKKRAGILVYRRDADATRFLIVSRHSFPDKWVFPQGTVRAGEAPEEAAAREAAEEGGLDVHIERSLGFFIQEGSAGFYRTEMFLAECIREGRPSRFREMRWVTYPESVDLNMDRENHRFLADLHSLMHRK
jgi:8-oxo-dGTP pyrophosphatase MutT (NUDIX family)